MDGGSVVARQRIVGGLNCQLAHALQHRVDFVQRTFTRLDHRDAVLGVALGLCQTLDLPAELLADAQTSSIVASPVDAQTARQLLNALCVRQACSLEVAL